MRDYGVIHRGFWANESMKGAGDDARMLATYLLTSPHTTTLGAFRLPDAYACDDLGWDSKRLRNGFETLSNIGFIRYCETTKWVWIVKFLEWNKPANPNIWKAISKMASNVPDSVSFKDEVLVSAGVSETVSKPLGNTPSPSPSPYLSPEGEEIQIPLAGESVHTVTLAEVAEWERTYPRVNIPGELLKARSWSVANPTQRKTPRGVGKFLNGWLSRAADRGGGTTIPPEQRPGGGRREL